MARPKRMGLARDRKVNEGRHALEKPVNWELVDLYMKAGCNQPDIAACFHITAETLAYKVEEKYGVTYSNYSKSLYSQGDNLLKGAQLQKALQGNITMLQFLGKVRLGQAEAQQNQTAPAQAEIDKDSIIMQLEHKICMLEGFLGGMGKLTTDENEIKQPSQHSIDANKPETE